MVQRFQRPGFVLDVLPEQHVLRLTRNDAPFQKVQELIEVLDEIETQIKLVERGEYGLLVDTRRVQQRTEPGFERAFRHWRNRIIEGFRRVAILVATPEGKAQAMQHAAEMGPQVAAFDGEAAAVSWLAEGAST